MRLEISLTTMNQDESNFTMEVDPEEIQCETCGKIHPNPDLPSPTSNGKISNHSSMECQDCGHYHNDERDGHLPAENHQPANQPQIIAVGERGKLQEEEPLSSHFSHQQTPQSISIFTMPSEKAPQENAICETSDNEPADDEHSSPFINRYLAIRDSDNRRVPCVMYKTGRREKDKKEIFWTSSFVRYCVGKANAQMSAVNEITCKLVHIFVIENPDSAVNSICKDIITGNLHALKCIHIFKNRNGINCDILKDCDLLEELVIRETPVTGLQAIPHQITVLKLIFPISVKDAQTLCRKLNGPVTTLHLEIDERFGCSKWQKIKDIMEYTSKRSCTRGIIEQKCSVVTFPEQLLMEMAKSPSMEDLALYFKPHYDGLPPSPNNNNPSFCHELKERLENWKDQLVGAFLGGGVDIMVEEVQVDKVDIPKKSSTFLFPSIIKMENHFNRFKFSVKKPNHTLER